MTKRRTRRKRIPQRTCVACRQVQGKRELIRIVRAPEGDVQIDPTGKLLGRGAYLCPYRECWQPDLARQRLNRALRTRLSSEALSRLAEFAQSLPERGDGGSDVLPEGPAE